MLQKGSVEQRSEEHCLEHHLHEDLFFLPLPSLHFIVTRGRNMYYGIVKEIKPGSDFGEILQRRQKDCLWLCLWIQESPWGQQQVGGGWWETCMVLFLVLSMAVCCAEHKSRVCSEQRKLSAWHVPKWQRHPALSSPTLGTGSKLALKSRAVTRLSLLTFLLFHSGIHFPGLKGLWGTISILITLICFFYLSLK